MLNTVSVRDGIFGETNAKQQWALDSAIKNLEYLQGTVRKFLDLSRIEKGELELSKTLVRLREDIFEPCLETFSGQIAERKMKVMGNMKIIPKTGKVISFQQDENARYTGEIAICDNLQEARYFAYTSVKYATDKT